MMVKVFYSLILSLFVTVNIFAESPDQTERKLLEDFDSIQNAPANSGMTFTVYVFYNAGWSEREVRRVIAEAGEIYARQCRFRLVASSINFIHVDANLHRIDNQLQEKLLKDLGDIERPAIFFIDDTSDEDFAAYAYLKDTQSPSQGTAWITGNAARQCRGAMLAHELGHIALNTGKHVVMHDNLMGFSCQRSNVRRQPVNTGLTPQQCQTLWRRYAQ